MPAGITEIQRVLRTQKWIMLKYSHEIMHWHATLILSYNIVKVLNSSYLIYLLNG